uniref:Uncharacterized protein n=1 Tax=Anopheles culicifacies TaxID=139723 RepID=A0A182M7U2_9DIPT
MGGILMVYKFVPTLGTEWEVKFTESGFCKHIEQCFRLHPARYRFECKRINARFHDGVNPWSVPFLQPVSWDLIGVRTRILGPVVKMRTVRSNRTDHPRYFVGFVLQLLGQIAGPGTPCQLDAGFDQLHGLLLIEVEEIHVALDGRLVRVGQYAVRARLQIVQVRFQHRTRIGRVQARRPQRILVRFGPDMLGYLRTEATIDDDHFARGQFKRFALVTTHRHRERCGTERIIIIAERVRDVFR